MDARSNQVYTDSAGMVQVWVTSLTNESPQAGYFSRLSFWLLSASRKSKLGL